MPLNIYLGADIVGFRLELREPASHFGQMPIVGVIGRPLSGWAVLTKAVEDYTLATVATVLLSPVMATVALAVKLTSPGPVLFRQERLGFNNQVFEIYKFRTMRNSACNETKTVQARANDPRVTSIGRFLRRTSLDELPQLFNVLTGSMSLVGPRPHAIDHNEEYGRAIRSYFARHRVKPGITGWAQVNGLRGETETTEKMDARVRHDIKYMENWSLMFDLRILVLTVYIVLTGRNAY
jgi:Undecaprenyl-phosphate glucose phosphotransferase